MKIDVVLRASPTIGESPTWFAAERAIYWIDVKAPALYRLALETQQQQSWNMPSDIGAFALTAEGKGAVVALREGLFTLDFASGALTILAPPPFDPTLFRFNEGACDSHGRFWIGVMFDPLNKDERGRKEKSSLHSFTLAGGYRHEPDAAELHNGMAWSPDERFMYLSHTQSGKIYRYAYDARDGRISDRQLFVTVPKDEGDPDGAAIDVDGGYWCALHGASKVRRYHPDGSVDRDVVLPVSQPTKCTFGGDRLEDLYITSAADQLSPEQLRTEPLAGSIFRMRPQLPGCIQHVTVR